MPAQRLFASAIFVSAVLLFMVQPLTGKILLPVLGGSPAVWSMCMLFFQALLFLGYVYAHLLSTHVAPRWQRVAHAGVLVAASLMLPIPIDIGDPGGADLRRWLAAALTRTVGLPFFALSATAPLLQQWFSRTSDRAMPEIPTSSTPRATQGVRSDCSDICSSNRSRHAPVKRAAGRWASGSWPR